MKSAFALSPKTPSATYIKCSECSESRAVDGAVDHDVRGLDFAVDARMLGDHQRARLVGQRRDVAAHRAVDAQAAAEKHVALDARGCADQAVDAVLRLAFLLNMVLLSFALFNPASRCASLSARSEPVS